MLREFKEFLMRGNVLDLAVAVIMAAAFGRVVSSLVDDVLMPPIGWLLGGIDFTSLFISLSGQRYESLAEARQAGAATINYGLFINSIVTFVIVALAVFLVMKQVNRLVARPAAAATRDCPFCLSVIPVKASRCPQCTSQLAA